MFASVAVVFASVPRVFASVAIVFASVAVVFASVARVFASIAILFGRVPLRVCILVCNISVILSRQALAKSLDLADTWLQQAACSPFTIL